MKRERGFGWIHLILLLGALALVWAAYAYISSQVTAYGDRRANEAMLTERAKWQSREVVQLAAYNKRILELEEEKRALERKSAEDVARADRELAKLTKERNDAIARAKADRDSGAAFGLRWRPTGQSAAGSNPGGGLRPEAGAAAGQRGGEAFCQLPRQVTDDLIALAGEADKVVDERNTLLEIALKDREVCK